MKDKVKNDHTEKDLSLSAQGTDHKPLTLDKEMRTDIAVPIGPMGGHKGNRATKVTVVYLAGRNPL